MQQGNVPLQSRLGGITKVNLIVISPLRHQFPMIISAPTTPLPLVPVSLLLKNDTPVFVYNRDLVVGVLFNLVNQPEVIDTIVIRREDIGCPFSGSHRG